jgi:hypothetical protein
MARNWLILCTVLCAVHCVAQAQDSIVAPTKESTNELLVVAPAEDDTKIKQVAEVDSKRQSSDSDKPRRKAKAAGDEEEEYGNDDSEQEKKVIYRNGGPHHRSGGGSDAKHSYRNRDGGKREEEYYHGHDRDHGNVGFFNHHGRRGDTNGLWIFLFISIFICLVGVCIYRVSVHSNYKFPVPLNGSDEYDTFVYPIRASAAPTAVATTTTTAAPPKFGSDGMTVIVAKPYKSKIASPASSTTAATSASAAAAAADSLSLYGVSEELHELTRQPYQRAVSKTSARIESQLGIDLLGEDENSFDTAANLLPAKNSNTEEPEGGLIAAVVDAAEQHTFLTSAFIAEELREGDLKTA